MRPALSSPARRALTSLAVAVTLAAASAPVSAAPVTKAPTGDLDQDATVLLADLQCLILTFHGIQAAEPVVADQCTDDASCGPDSVCRPHFSGFSVCVHECLDALVTAGPDPAITCSVGDDDEDCLGVVHRRTLDLDCDGDVTNVDIQFLVAMVLDAASGPGTPDVDADGVLNFCDGDSDGDGVPDDDDCAPLDPARFVGNIELCDGIDGDCDGLADDDDPDIEGGCAIEACAGLDCSVLDGPCTAGICDHVLGACAAAPIAEGESCDDGSACTESDACSAGLCTGSPLTCDDDDVCNGAETCDPEIGCVDGEPLDCVDEDLCNGTETCDPTLGCVDGSPLDCVDEDLCNGTETCDPALGCVDGSPLDCVDEDLCNGTETCDPALGCVDGTPLDCVDEDLCNGTETCDPALGCVDGPPLDCVDDDLCDGTETCDPAAGCQEGDPLVCDDGDVCNGAETCDAATGCVGGTPLDCVDEDLCDGTETCDPVAGCQEGDPLVCDDGDVCNGAETCDAATGCVDGTPLDCVDEDLCDGTETCDPVAGCQEGDALVCDDGDVCNGAETCDAATGCVDGTPLDCVDEDLCDGTETCDPVAGCQEGDALVCDDGDVCNGTETCDPGTGCVDGTPLDCVDEDLCDGTETCDPTLGCQDGDPLVCDDEDACNGTETCDPGAGCVDGTALVCDDDDVCNGTETCDPGTGCVDGTPLDCVDDDLCDGAETCVTGLGCVDGTPLVCDDGDACNGAETCDPGTGCVDGTPVVCPDVGACTLGACDPDTGGCDLINADDGEPCDDGQPCTALDVCTGGSCGGTPLDPCPFTGTDVLCSVSGTTGEFGTCVVEVARGCDAVPAPVTTQLWFEWDTSAVEVVYFTDSGQDETAVPPLDPLYQTYPSFDGSFEAPGFYPTCNTHPILTDLCLSYTHDWNSGPGAGYLDWDGAMTIFVFSSDAPAPILDGVLSGGGQTTGETVLFHLHYRLTADVDAADPSPIVLADAVADDPDVVAFAPSFVDGRLVLDYATPLCEAPEPGSGPAPLCTYSGQAGDHGVCTIEVVRGCDAVPPPSTTQLWFEWDQAEVELLYFTDPTQDPAVEPPLPALYQTYPAFDGSFEAPGYYPTCTLHPTVPDVCVSYDHDYNSGPGDDYTDWNGAMTVFVFSTDTPSPILDGVMVDGAPTGDAVLFHLHYRLTEDVSPTVPGTITLADVVADDLDVAPFAPTIQDGRVVLDYATPVCP